MPEAAAGPHEYPVKPPTAPFFRGDPAPRVKDDFRVLQRSIRRSSLHAFIDLRSMAGLAHAAI
jgi:hypothetical protein